MNSIRKNRVGGRSAEAVGVLLVGTRATQGTFLVGYPQGEGKCSLPLQPRINSKRTPLRNFSISSMTKPSRSLFIIQCSLFIIFLASCGKFERPIALNLPKPDIKLQVECYLDDLSPDCTFGPKPQWKSAISLTQDYFATIDTPFINNAIAEISYNGKNIPLTYNGLPEACDSNIKLFNYKNFRDKFELIPGTTYTLTASDAKGRRVTATSTCLEHVYIDTIQQTYDPVTDKSYFIATIQDDGATEDYYQVRFINISDSSRKHIRRDAVFADGNYNGKKILVGANADYKEGDIIEVSLYHCPKAYYRYIRTTAQAIQSVGNPFGNPTQIETNVSGGTGIFACMPGTKKQIVLKK